MHQCKRDANGVVGVVVLDNETADSVCTENESADSRQQTAESKLGTGTRRAWPKPGSTACSGGHS
jgi:hypothetical protein